MAGPDGEVALVGALSDVSQSHRTAIVAALGDAQGQAGPDALREVLADADASTDTRCAALLALAKRDGVEASTELAGHLNHRSKAVRSYAMRGLAVVGDDRAWADAMRLLRRLLERPTPIDVRFHAQLPGRPDPRHLESPDRLRFARGPVTPCSAPSSDGSCDIRTIGGS